MIFVVPSGPPLNIRTVAKSATSLSLAWDPPETNKQNGVITSYTGCTSDSEKGSCFQTVTVNKKEWLVTSLKASTKYYVRILASTKAGNGNYSENREFFTNGKDERKFNR